MRKKNKNDIVVCSIIAADTVVEGDFTAKDTARIDGTVKGFVHSDSILIIGEHGKVEGNIHASSIFIAGEVVGDLIASEKIEASATGKIYGDIITKSLVIDENAIFQGKCEMNVQVENISKKESSKGKEKEKVCEEIHTIKANVTETEVEKEQKNK